MKLRLNYIVPLIFITFTYWNTHNLVVVRNVCYEANPISLFNLPFPFGYIISIANIIFLTYASEKLLEDYGRWKYFSYVFCFTLFPDVLNNLHFLIMNS